MSLRKIPIVAYGTIVGFGLGLFLASLLNDLINESREGLIAAQRKVIAFQADWLTAESREGLIAAQDHELDALKNEITALNHKADAYDSLVTEQRKGIDIRDRLLDERAAMIRTLKVQAGLTPSTEATQPAQQGSR